MESGSRVAASPLWVSAVALDALEHVFLIRVLGCCMRAHELAFDAKSTSMSRHCSKLVSWYKIDCFVFSLLQTMSSLDAMLEGDKKEAAPVSSRPVSSCCRLRGLNEQTSSKSSQPRHALVFHKST